MEMLKYGWTKMTESDTIYNRKRISLTLKNHMIDNNK